MKCHLCLSENKHRFAEVDSFGFPLVYSICENCGFVYQSTQNSQAADPDFYAETYRKIYQDNPEPTAKDLWIQGKRADHLVDWVKSQGNFIPKNFLDIGASTGTLMHTFQESFGCEVMGVEPGSAYRAYAGKNGLPMVASIEDLIDLQTDRFDLISLIHVLEHLPDPVSTLSTIREALLAQNGRLLLEVPNLYVHDSFELAHLSCFSRHTLAETVRQAGFKPIIIHNHGDPRSKMLKLYITLLVEPAPKDLAIPSVRKEHWVTLKHQFGMGYRRVVQKLFPHQAWLPLPNEVES